MKNKTVNKKVIKAISIGLSAMMAMQPVLATPVLAEELGGDDNAPVEAKKYNEDDDHASDTANESREAVDAVDSKVDIVVERLDEVNNNDLVEIEVENNVSEEKQTENNVDAIKDDIQTADEALANVDTNLTIIEKYFVDRDATELVTGSGFDEAFNANLNAYKAIVAVYGVDGPTDEAAKANFAKLDAWIKSYAKNDNDNGKKAASAIEAVKEMTSEVAANEAVSTAVTEANEIAGKAEKQQTVANQAGKDATKIATDAEETFNEYVNSINTAPTISAANEAYDSLVEALGKAELDVKAKQEIYNDAKTEYEKLLEEYAKKQEAVKNAQQAYDDAAKLVKDLTEGYKEGRKDVKGYNDLVEIHDAKVAALTEYNAQLNLAKDNVKDATDALDDIEKRLGIMSDAVNTAKTSIMADEGNKILAAIKVAEDSKSRVWAEEDTLFENIVKSYYVPQVLKGTDASINWTRIEIEGTDGNRNYCTVTYTKDGETKTLYLDYVMATKNSEEQFDANGVRKNGNSTSEIVIFEKTQNEVDAANAEAEAMKKKETALLYDKNIEIDRYKVIGSDGKAQYISLDEFKAAKESGAIVEYNNVHYQKNAATTDNIVEYDEETGVVSDVIDGDTRTKVTVDDSTVEAQELALEDGKLVQEYKGDKTTVVYHKAFGDSAAESSDNIYTYEKLEDAQKALNAVKDTIGDDYIEGEVSITHIDGVDNWEATASYVPIFTQKIEIPSDFTHEDDAHFWIDLDGKSNAKNKALNYVNEQLGDNYVVLKKIEELSVNRLKYKYGWDVLYLESHPVYEVTGSVTFTYVSKEYYEANKAQCDDIVNNGGNIKQGHLNNMDKVIVSADGTTEEAAKEAVKKLIDSKVNSKVSISTKDESTQGYDLYGYTYSYWNADSTKIENVLIKKDTYENTQKVYGDVVQNQDGKTVLVQGDKTKDAGLSAYLAEVKKYNDLSAAVAEAQTAVNEAKEKVSTLTAEVNKDRKNNFNQSIKSAPHGLTVYDNVSGNLEKNDAVLKGLEEFLEDAEQELKAAMEKLESLKAQMGDAKAALDARIAALTPAPASEGGSGSGSSSTPAAAPAYVAASTPAAPMFTFPAATAADAAVAGARTGRRVTGNGAGDRIIEEDGAGIILPEETVDEITPVTEKKKVVTIEDNETPLAAVPVDEGQKMNWWWLLLIALLGATGEEMYRRNKNKKKEALASEIKNEADKQR